MSYLDPFHFKRFRKSDPRRLAFALYSRAEEVISRWLFPRYLIPEVLPESAQGAVPGYETAETAVTPSQMAMLLWAVKETERLGGAIAEIGAYRGVTTAMLASATNRTFFAVDPYIGYGGAEEDREAMISRIKELTNVQHVAATSGAAAGEFEGGSFSFVFIDAVHDFVNVAFDAQVWTSLLRSNGMLAFHDADSRGFAGVQRVIWRLAREPTFEVCGHVHGLVILRKVAQGNAEGV